MIYHNYGCIYADGLRSFNPEFGADACSSYGGTPCEEPVLGCNDEADGAITMKQQIQMMVLVHMLPVRIVFSGGICISGDLITYALSESYGDEDASDIHLLFKR